MPTQTFFNLQKDKQKKIIDASKKEFSENGFYDASINRIIKDAGISRGSFYQYFENKEDLFIYMLEKIKEVIINEVSKILSNKKCDIFELHLLIFDAITKEGLSGNDKDFVITTISNMSVNLLNHLLVFLGEQDVEKELNKSREIVDFNNLKFSTIEELVNLHHVLMNTMMCQLVIFFSNIDNSEICRDNLITQFELIKYGVVKS